MRNKPYPLYEHESLSDLKSMANYSATMNPDGEAFIYTEKGKDVIVTYEQQRALRYRQEVDKHLCVMAYWLLLYGLRNEYEITDPLIFSYGENGKPYLKNYPKIHFNMSHCKVGVVCAVSDSEVGVDIQDVRPFDIDVARRVCTYEELEQLAQCENPDIFFCKLWTIKESFVKRWGGSIAQPLHLLYAKALVEQSDGQYTSHWGERYHVCCLGDKEVIHITHGNIIGY